MFTCQDDLSAGDPIFPALPLNGERRAPRSGIERNSAPAFVLTYAAGATGTGTWVFLGGGFFFFFFIIALYVPSPFPRAVTRVPGATSARRDDGIRGSPRLPARQLGFKLVSMGVEGQIKRSRATRSREINPSLYLPARATSSRRDGASDASAERLENSANIVIPIV